MQPYQKNQGGIVQKSLSSSNLITSVGKSTFAYSSGSKFAYGTIQEVVDKVAPARLESTFHQSFNESDKCLTSSGNSKLTKNVDSKIASSRSTNDLRKFTSPSLPLVDDKGTLISSKSMRQDMCTKASSGLAKLPSMGSVNGDRQIMKVRNCIF